MLCIKSVSPPWHLSSTLLDVLQNLTSLTSHFVRQGLSCHLLLEECHSFSSRLRLLFLHKGIVKATFLAFVCGRIPIPDGLTVPFRVPSPFMSQSPGWSETVMPSFFGTYWVREVRYQSFGMSPFFSSKPIAPKVLSKTNCMLFVVGGLSQLSTFDCLLVACSLQGKARDRYPYKRQKP